ncbi:hypothetical protein ACVWXQ_008878 [Bradyrhizobium sp. S3.14.4]
MRDERRILDRALSLHDKGDIAAAAKLYRRIIDANPNNLHAVHFLGAWPRQRREILIAQNC